MFGPLPPTNLWLYVYQRHQITQISVQLEAELAQWGAWAGEDSNLRRLSRRVYSPFPLAARAPTRVARNATGPNIITTAPPEFTLRFALRSVTCRSTSPKCRLPTCAAIRVIRSSHTGRIVTIDAAQGQIRKESCYSRARSFRTCYSQSSNGTILTIRRGPAANHWPLATALGAEIRDSSVGFGVRRWRLSASAGCTAAVCPTSSRTVARQRQGHVLPSLNRQSPGEVPRRADSRACRSRMQLVRLHTQTNPGETGLCCHSR